MDLSSCFGVLMTDLPLKLRRGRARLLVLLLLSLGASGCSTTGMQSRQLQRVAKDWAMTVRASQVLPIYPMTEDLQPGDVFLVQTPIEEQVRLYAAKGFLPLDQLMLRLQPSTYGAFYGKAYGIGDRLDTPRHWQFSDGGAPGDWASAPRVAFPTYSFTVKRAGGLSLALPLQGVPIGLGALGGGSATGSIAISDAYTYGIDMYSLQAQLEQWAVQHRGFLKKFAPTGGSKVKKFLFLRVVSRVYLARGVNISLTGDESAKAGAAGGAPREVSLPNGAADSGIADPTPSVLPGGAVKVTSQGARTVNLVETFRRPLVIGYLAFDVPILDDGQLGSPEPTHSRLNEIPVLQSRAVSFEVDRNSAAIGRWVNLPGNREKLQAWLDGQGAKAQITQVIYGQEHASTREKAVANFNIE